LLFLQKILPLKRAFTRLLLLQVLLIQEVYASKEPFPMLTDLCYSQGKMHLAFQAHTLKQNYKANYLNQKNSQFHTSLHEKHEFKQISNALKLSKTRERLMIEQIKVQKSNAILLSVIIGLLSILLFIFILLYQRLSFQKKVIEKARLALEQSLSEKNILMKEIHHRVKNNFQLITSFLNPNLISAADSIEDFIQRTSARIDTIASIHTQLYENDDEVNIDFYTYCKKLTADILQSFEGKTSNIKLEMEPTVFKFNLQTVLPLGLLLNEWLVNSLKHAFDQQKQGLITISLTIKKDKYTLIYKDTGKGIEPGEKNTFGMKLIHALAQQLDAEMKIQTENGTQYQLMFVQKNQQ
jgi:two-component sensor histidine kinase